MQNERAKVGEGRCSYHAAERLAKEQKKVDLGLAGRPCVSTNTCRAVRVYRIWQPHATICKPNCNNRGWVSHLTDNELTMYQITLTCFTRVTRRRGWQRDRVHFNSVPGGIGRNAFHNFPVYSRLRPGVVLGRFRSWRHPGRPSKRGR